MNARPHPLLVVPTVGGILRHGMGLVAFDDVGLVVVTRPSKDGHAAMVFPLDGTRRPVERFSDGELRLDLRVASARDAVSRAMWAKLRATTTKTPWSATAPTWHGAKEIGAADRWWWRLTAVDVGGHITGVDAIEFGEDETSTPDVVVPGLAAVRTISKPDIRSIAALATCARVVLGAP